MELKHIEAVMIGGEWHRVEEGSFQTHRCLSFESNGQPVETIAELAFSFEAPNGRILRGLVSSIQLFRGERSEEN